MLMDLRHVVGRLGLAFAVLINAALLVVYATHETWRPLLGGVVTPAFAEVEAALALGALVKVAGSLHLLRRATPLRRRAWDFLFALTGLIGAVALLRVFPFDLARFPGWVPVATRAVLGVALFGTAVASLVTGLRLLLGGDQGGHQRPAHP